MKQPIIANNVSSDKRFQREIDDPFSHSTQNLLAVPLIQSDPVMIRAVIICMDKQDEEIFDDYDVRLLENYSQIIIKILDAVRA
mmetsp:Transcript_7971/g.1058  ORF Transcript_7971/g.1058 Transcript_7971/m.1058 type:complete len:84 (+) Transcript_7971:1268-1519(+)